MTLRNSLAALILLVSLSTWTMAQDKENEAAAPVAKAGDVATVDSIVEALYDVISGGPGVQRDWDRFRSLFHPDARLIPTGRDPGTGMTNARAFTPGDYIKRSEPFMMQNGFFEKEVARRSEQYGNIVHIFSTYEGRNKESDEKPFIRGINSIQLLNDGKRWWIVTVYWQGETPETPLPTKYLKDGN